MLSGTAVMSTKLPLYRYCVGFSGLTISWYRVKRYAVETVWLQAKWSLKPMLITGTPYSEEPSMAATPGTVSWAMYRRSVPLQGKCGLPSTIGTPVCVACGPSAYMLLPNFWFFSLANGSAAGFACARARASRWRCPATEAADAEGSDSAGGCAVAMSFSSAEELAITARRMKRRYTSDSVMLLSQAASAQAAWRPGCWPALSSFM